MTPAVLIWIGIAAVVLLIVVLAKGSMDSSKAFLASLKEKGYTYGFIGYGKDYIAFNPETRTALIGNIKAGIDGGTPINFNQVIKYQWEWLSVNGDKRDNKIVFYTKLPEHPIHKVVYGISWAWCEKEYAQIQAVLS